MGMILRIASSRIVGQGDIVGRSGYFSLNLSANSVMRGRLDARRTLKSLVADLRILNKYRNNLEDFFRLRDNSNINKDLIIIAKLAGLSKKISFHTARHTNATLLIYNGVNITTVQKLLGHKSVKTTQVYTNIMDMTIVHDLEKIKQAALGIKKKTDNSFNK